MTPDGMTHRATQMQNASSPRMSVWWGDPNCAAYPRKARTAAAARSGLAKYAPCRALLRW